MGRKPPETLGISTIKLAKKVMGGTADLHEAVERSQSIQRLVGERQELLRVKGVKRPTAQGLEAMQRRAEVLGGEEGQSAGMGRSQGPQAHQGLVEVREVVEPRAIPEDCPLRQPVSCVLNGVTR